MSLGVLVVVVLPLIVLWLRHLAGLSAVPTVLLLSAIGGAAGAVTSVLSQASFERILLDRRFGGTWNMLLGMFRPLIGALFGLAFYALLASRILPFAIPIGSGQTSFFAGVAFLAGFSHRWAQDTISVAQNRLGGTESAPTGPAQTSPPTNSQEAKAKTPPPAT